MAYFSSIDLQDCVRNGFIIEDTSGVCAQTLPKVQPKARPGGLPIGFGEPEEDYDDFEIDSSSPGFSINLNTLKAVVNAKKTTSDESTNVKDATTKGKVVFTENRALLNEIPIPEKPKQPKSSMLSDLLAATSPYVRNSFDTYSVYDMTKHYPSPKLKQVCVVVPFADNKPCLYTLTLPTTALISDLMGLCCFKYTAERRTPEIVEVHDLLLYIAEDMEADTDFPPIDQNQKMSNCLFTAFALARKPDIEDYHEREYKVVVHFTCGLTYVITVNSLDTPLMVIRDEAVQKKDSDLTTGISDLSNFSYILETVDTPGKPLNLMTTLSGIPNLEFVCLRQNSSRGDFVPLTSNKTLNKSTSLQRIQIPAPSSIKGPLSAGFSQKDFEDFKFDLSQSFKTEEYFVDRLHRIRPKWAAKLIIHPDAVEITPTQIVRRNIVPQPTPKLTFMEFELIANCSLSVDHSKGRRQVKLTFLSIPIEYIKQAFESIKQVDAQGPRNGHKGRSSLCSIQESDDNSFRRKTDVSTDTDESFSRRTSHLTTPGSDKSDLSTVYIQSKWKTLSVETNESEAWEIVSKLSKILGERFSHVRQVYADSKNGSRTPYDSFLKFEQAFDADNESRFGSRGSGRQTPTTPQTPTSKSKRKFSMNPMPMLSRMLSRQD